MVTCLKGHNMNKLVSFLAGADEKNLEDLSYKEQVRECLHRADKSKRYEESIIYLHLATINAIMHLTETMERR